MTLPLEELHELREQEPMEERPTLVPKALGGVDHTARPTWKLRETIEFYRDVIGLPLVHTISARGWGTDDHPDFLHFFFDSGEGSTIAFFYYLGAEAPAELKDRPYMRPVPDDFVFDATHTAWLVDTEDDLLAWKGYLEDKGVEVSTLTIHEVIESIYFRDPNGYFIEITIKLRPLTKIDATDAALTLEAAVKAEEEARATGQSVVSIDSVWQHKADLIASRVGAPEEEKLVRIFVPDVPEFASIVRAAEGDARCRVSRPSEGYTMIESSETLEFGRKDLGFKPAVWYGIFTGGLRGRIEVFDRHIVRILPA